MEGFLKQSTAVDITILMIDSADHIAGKTGLAAGLTIYATKAAGTPAAITPTVTELDATNVKGVYKLALTGTHTNTLGELQLHITAAGADPADYKWQVSTYLPGEAVTLQADQAVNVTKVGGTVQTAGDIIGDTNDIQARLPAALVGGRMDSSVGAMAANVLTAAATAADFGTELAAAVWDALLTSVLVVGSIGKLIKDNLDAAITTRLSAAGYTAPDNAGIVGIKAKTDLLTFTIANKVDSSIQAAGDFAQAAADKVWATVARTITGGSITTNGDKTGYTITAAEHANISDKFLGRSLVGGADGGRTVRQALRILRNRRGIAGGVLTAYQEDDATPDWTAAVTTAAGNPVSDIDPV